MTIHQKLDYIMRGGISESPKLMLISTKNSFNIADTVGAANVGKYSVNDFIVCDNVTGTLSSSWGNTSNTKGGNRFQILYSVKNDFVLTYDNLTGSVSIRNKVINVRSLIYWEVGGELMQDITASITISPKVYLLVKTGDEVS